MLRIRSLVPALAMALAFGPARAESRDQDDPLQFSLNCKPPSFKNRRPIIILTGTCALPDGVLLKINMSRVAEALSGKLLQPSYFGAGNGMAEIEKKKFVFDKSIDGPAKYNVQVALNEDLQDKDVVPDLRKKTTSAKLWQREFLVWGDDLVGELSPKLNDVKELINETREMVKRFERAASSQQVWASERSGLEAEGGKLRVRLENHELKAYYSAAVGDLYYTLRNVVNNAPYYTFGPDGKFTGARDYHADGEKVKTYRGEEFNWENLKRYIDETLSVAGREFCLWIVKDIRRTGANRPEISDALKSQKNTPAVDFFLERLQKATVSDIDDLEAEIRGTKEGSSPGGNAPTDKPADKK